MRVRSNFIRLPLDVLICLDHRYYQSFPSFAGQIFTEGVQFYASGDRKIVNYPKRHISACARKDNLDEWSISPRRAHRKEREE